MATTSILVTIGFFVVSMLGGLAVFYFGMSASKALKKKQLEWMVSYGTQFIIYLWVGKLVVHFPKLFEDPLSVLAYPGDSQAFYIATILIMIHLFVQNRRGKVAVNTLMQGFVPVFFFASFIYECLQVLVEGKQLNPYLISIAILAVSVVFLLQGSSSIWLYHSFILLWALSAAVLAMVEGYVVVFDYVLRPWYFIMVTFVLLGLVAYQGHQHIKRNNQEPT